MSWLVPNGKNFHGSRGSFSSDDSSVDLGLGFGLKPGGLPKHCPKSTEDDSISADLEIFSLFQNPTAEIEPQETLEKDEQRCKPFTWKTSLQDSIEQLKEIKGGISRISKWGLPKRSFSLKIRKRTNSESKVKNDDITKEKTRGLRRINSARVERRSLVEDDEYRALQCKLFKARQEIENLTLDLEACQQQLQSKYGAVKIIQRLSRFEQAQQKQHSRKVLEASKKLEQEVNFLQWELELKQSYLLDSEQTWAERFDRVATENAALMVALQTRSDELRKVTMEKMALMRDRDELAAALEVRDRIKYDLSTPEREEILSTGDLIIELATLGACQCRGKNQEPCACARAAVDAKRDIAKLKHELELVHRREEEALLTADAYRVAFEQQLAKNSTLIYELLEKSSWRKKIGFGGATKKTRKQENSMKSEEEDLVRQIKTHKDEIVEKLLGMLNDNSEALAHQRLATKILAAKMKEMEKCGSPESPST
ncbi:coiled-coil domain-containing protein 125-like [Oculina patagonica]